MRFGRSPRLSEKVFFSVLGHFQCELLPWVTQTEAECIALDRIRVHHSFSQPSCERVYCYDSNGMLDVNHHHNKKTNPKKPQENEATKETHVSGEKEAIVVHLWNTIVK